MFGGVLFVARRLICSSCGPNKQKARSMQPVKSTQKKLGLLAALCLGGALSVSAQSLIHRYSFSDAAGSSTFVDSVGTANGTLNNATAGNPTSASLDGSQLELDGTGGYATLP